MRYHGLRDFIMSEQNHKNMKQRAKLSKQSDSGQRDARVETRTTQDKCYIFRERETAEQAFLLVSGTVEIIKNTDDGEVVIGTLGEGALFGEMALIDNVPRITSARAVGTVRMKVVTREMINKQIANSNPFVRGLIKRLSEHVRMTAKILGGKAT